MKKLTRKQERELQQLLGKSAPSSGLLGAYQDAQADVSVGLDPSMGSAKSDSILGKVGGWINSAGESVAEFGQSPWGKFLIGAGMTPEGYSQHRQRQQDQAHWQKKQADAATEKEAAQAEAAKVEAAQAAFREKRGGLLSDYKTDPTGVTRADAVGAGFKPGEITSIFGKDTRGEVGEMSPAALATHKAKLRGQESLLGSQRTTEENKRKEGVTAGIAKGKADAARDKSDRAVLASLYGWRDNLSDDNFDGAVGPLEGGGIFRGISKRMGTDTSRLGSDLERKLAEDVLDASSKMKGAITEKEWPRLEKTRPQLTSPASEWVDWYNNVLDAVAINNPHLSGEISKMRETVNSASKKNFGYEQQGTPWEVIR